MKTPKIKATLLVLALSALFIIDATAQPRGQMRQQEVGPRAYCQIIPDLTEEQEEKINDLQSEQIKERTQHRTEMEELRAKKRSLMLQESPDSEELEEVIDQKSELRSGQIKSNIAHRQDIRELLTEEQREYFDNRTRVRRERHPGMRQGHSGRAGGRGRSGRGSQRGW